MLLDGKEVVAQPGESILDVARRCGIEIPTLCYDARLAAFGGCRLCVVEVEGARLPVASCTTPAEDSMRVRTDSEALQKHRRTILELVASENPEDTPSDLRGLAAGELGDLFERSGAERGRFAGETSGESRCEDPNPFLLRDYAHCISCYRCVRVCAEREGDYAISVSGRGFGTQITAGLDSNLSESSCTFCGQCVQTCPTGALGDKKVLRYEDLYASTPKEAQKETRTICPYCGVGCSVDLLSVGDQLVGVRPAMDGPANEGALCVKGQFAYDFVQHEDRLKHPLVRGEDGKLRQASWDEALDRAAQGFLDAEKKYGRHSIYAIASGRAPHEGSYVLQKWIRSKFGSHYIDNCSRA